MFRPRLRGRCLGLAVLAVPFFLWGLILILTPTGWAKARLIARLEAATGRVVQIDSVHLGWLGNLRIVNLSFAEPDTPTDPFLRIATTNIDVHLGQVFLGCCRPGDVTVDGVAVRVWRRSDGQFEFGDLARSCPTASLTGTGSGSAASLLPAVNVLLSNASIRLVDDSTGLRLDLTNVSARGSFQPLIVQIDDLRGVVNGGPLRLAARLDRDPQTPRFAAEVQAEKIRLDRGLELVETYVPLVARDDHDAIGGLLNLRLAFQGRGDSAREIGQTLTGHGSILLDPIDLDGSRIVEELRTLGDWPREDHVAAVSANFTLGGRRISTEDLTIRASKIPLVVGGWTDFDGRFDYHTQVDRMIANLPREARSILGDLTINLDELTGLRITGIKDEVHLTLDGRTLSSDPTQPSVERTRFRETARKIRDRFFR